MFERELPARPSLDQYRKQAKDLAWQCEVHAPDAMARMRRNHPRFHKLPEAAVTAAPVSLTDAQLVIAREHGFESWPKFAKHIEMIRIIESVDSLTDPVAAFIEVACAPRHTGHASGTLDHAELILARYPQVATSNIYTAAILADEAAVRGFLQRDATSATATGGPHGWDALTYLCFSRYLRIDESRSEAFVRTARALLDAGASAKTGWTEMIDHPTPRPIFESAIYGAAGVARHAGLTRLLLERGADPNDEETPYHVPEGYDNTVMAIMLESDRLNATSLMTMLIRKADWHDEAGMQMALEHGADPNAMAIWGYSALHQSIRRDNGMQLIEPLIQFGADPKLKSNKDGRTALQMAARRGRGDALRLFEERGFALNLEGDLKGVDALIAACALGDREAAQALASREPQLLTELVVDGGALLAEFAGNSNVEGMRCLLDLGVGVDAPYREGDPYFDIAKNSTALHVAAWRAWPAAVKELIAHGAAANALDGKGRTPLQLAIKACVYSYWKRRRSPEWVEPLLMAGASVEGVEIPTGYDEIDELLRNYGG
jgi:ankyrin repeat protein